MEGAFASTQHSGETGMSRIGTIGGAALASTFLAAVFYYQPSHASNPLLAKAQSEFVTKARNALLERRIGEASMNGALASPPSSSPAQTQVVATLEPVAPPSTVQVETSAASAALISTTPTRELTETPAAANELPEPAKIEVSSAGTTNEVKPEVTPLPAEPAAAQQNAVAPNGPEAAAPQVVAPVTNMPVTNMVAHPPARTVQKATQASGRKTMIAARRPVRNISKERLPLERLSIGRLPINVEALRARAPQIAAAIARYM